MPVAKPLLAACALVVAGYVAYPYVTLYRLGQAIQSGDAQTLRTLVNWPAVRAGIKHDLCDKPQTVLAKDELPGFGASFASSIASQAVEQQVTPEGLVRAVRASDAAQPVGAGVTVNWAFFDTPTQFMVSLSAPGQAKPIRLQMRLHDTEWRVDRVWVSRTLLAAGT